MKALQFTLILILINSISYSQSRNNTSLHQADSLFFLCNWKESSALYEKNISDSSGSLEWNRYAYSVYKTGNADGSIKLFNKALSFNPPPPVKQSIYSRMARVYASMNDKNKSYENLKNAFDAGFLNYNEIDTSIEYRSFKNDTGFSSMRNRMYNAALPCMNNPKTHAFDFWVGEWNAYQTGTSYLAGTSVIQSVSGGCMILENWTSANSLYTGKSMNFIDPITDKWEQVWVGSDGGGPNIFINGEYKDGAMRFEYDQTDAAGNKNKGRFIFFNQGKDQVRQLQESTSDEGKTWTTVYDFTYKRKK